MITRRQAEIAVDSLAPVFNVEGSEITVTRVHPENDTVIGLDCFNTRDVYLFSELDPGKDLTLLSTEV